MGDTSREEEKEGTSARVLHMVALAIKEVYLKTSDADTRIALLQIYNRLNEMSDQEQSRNRLDAKFLA